jgi:hypothetical protein
VINFLTGGGNMPPRLYRKPIIGFYSVLLALAAVLLFYNLGDRFLWSDEAETAVLAKNVSKFGVPRTTDGVNYITLYGADIDGNANNIWTLSPWAQEYVAAASFRIFGSTTWASRAPFALIGWICLAIFGFILYRIYRNHWIALSGMALLTSSETFLIHARQCRYYSISVLGQILLMCAVYLLITKNKNGSVLLAVALLLQFYSNFIIVAANLPALVLLAWMLWREKKRRAVPVFFAIGIFSLLATPWLLYARPWETFGKIRDPWTEWGKLNFYLGDFHFHLLPLGFVLLPLGSAVVHRLRTAPEPHPTRLDTSRFETFLLCLLPLYIAVPLIVPSAQARYLLPVLPIACLLATVWVFRYIKSRVAAVAVVLLQCTTNVLAVPTALSSDSNRLLRAPLAEYIGGLTHHYQDRLSDVVNFLRAKAHPGETVFVLDPEFPLIFYTPLRIIDGRFRDGTLSEPLPDWILSESASGTTQQQALELPPNLSARYETIVFSVHNSSRHAWNPERFEYRAVETRVQFVVYRRRA